jgi:ATP-grasp domain, R2K clade family 3
MTISIPATTNNEPLFLLEAWNSSNPSPFTDSMEKMEKEIRKQNHDFYFLSRDTISQTVEVPESFSKRPTIVYGSLQFCRDLNRTLCPGAYGYKRTDWLQTVEHIPRKHLLNSSWHITTWKDLKENLNFWFETFGMQFLFVRPVSDCKTFAGQIIFTDDDMRAIELSSSVVDSTLCVVDRPRTLELEVRFFIVNREIVSYSKYPTHGTKAINISRFTPEECIPMAEMVAALEWQPDVCYVCDIGVGSDGPKVVELNAFSSSGLYNCNPEPIVSAVARQARRDFLEIWGPMASL